MSRLRLAMSPLLVVLVTAWLAACSADPRSPTEPGDSGEIPDDATLTRVQSEILTPRCAFPGCHGSPGPQQGLLMETGSSFSSLVGVQAKGSNKNLVEPGDPDASYIVDKVRGRTGITGEPMPRGLDPLSEEEIQLIVDWIRRGAPDD